jgi:hypothetical protein
MLEILNCKLIKKYNYLTFESSCIIPNIIPSVFLKYANHPTPGTACLALIISPSLVLTRLITRSTSLTLIVFTI